MFWRTKRTTFLQSYQKIITNENNNKVNKEPSKMSKKQSGHNAMLQLKRLRSRARLELSDERFTLYLLHFSQ